MSSSNVTWNQDERPLEKRAIDLSTAYSSQHSDDSFWTKPIVNDIQEYANESTSLGPRLFSGYQGGNLDQRLTFRQPKYDEQNFTSTICSDTTNTGNNSSNLDDLLYTSAPVHVSAVSDKMSTISKQVQSKIVSSSVKAGLSELLDLLPAPPHPPAIVASEKHILVYEVGLLCSCFK
jgi:hypothetical protein